MAFTCALQMAAKDALMRIEVLLPDGVPSCELEESFAMEWAKKRLSKEAEKASQQKAAKASNVPTSKETPVSPADLYALSCAFFPKVSAPDC